MNAIPAKTAETPERILQRIDWQIIRYLDGVFQGDYRTLFYGNGVNFTDLREYQPHDDIRHIDWNVTARMNELYVRQYTEDREVTAWFLLDLSPSMAFGPVARPKEQVLIDTASVLARLLTRSGNRIGAILYNDQITRTIPPRGGRNQVLRVIHELQRGGESAGGETTNLTDLFSAGLNTFKRRSLVFVISDFISQPGWQMSLANLNRRHELIGIRLYDPREMTLPNAGMIVVEDSETGEQIYVETSDPVFRRRFYEAAEGREAELKTDLNRAGVDLFAISTEEDLMGAIVRMAARRRKRRRA